MNLENIKSLLLWALITALSGGFWVFILWLIFQFNAWIIVCCLVVFAIFGFFIGAVCMNNGEISRAEESSNAKEL